MLVVCRCGKIYVSPQITYNKIMRIDLDYLISKRWNFKDDIICNISFYKHFLVFSICRLLMGVVI